MAKRIVITRETISGKSCLTTALFADNSLLEISCEDQKETIQLGNIYIGKIKRIVEKIRAAFVEIAPGVMTYLPFHEIGTPYMVKRSREDKLTEGDEIVVQIIKEAIKTKEATVSAKLSFQGELIVLTTDRPALGISKKLSADERTRLKKLFSDKIGDDAGLIVRTNAGKYSNSEILDEFESICKQFTQFKETYRYRTCYSCLYHAPSSYVTYIKGQNLTEIEKVVTDDTLVYEELQTLHMSVPLEFYQDKMLSLSNLYSLSSKITDALDKKVWLKSGAYLVIESTEALTVIDVNSGKSMQGKPADYFRRINLEAAKEVARQLRLRNISGICIVDFINMTEKEDKTCLIQTLKQELAKDPIPANFIDFTRLGLAEITRKKMKKPLWEQLK